MNPLWNTVVIGGFYKGERLAAFSASWFKGFRHGCTLTSYKNLPLICHFVSVQFPWIRGQTGGGLRGTYGGHRLWSVPGSGEPLKGWKATIQTLSSDKWLGEGREDLMSKKFLCVLQPLMREAMENKPELSKQEARDLIERCLKVLYYRDARSYNRVSQRSNMSRPQAPCPCLHITAFLFFVVPFQYEIAIVTEEGVEIISPLSSETNWDIAHMVRWDSKAGLQYPTTLPSAAHQGNKQSMSGWSPLNALEGSSSLKINSILLKKII